MARRTMVWYAVGLSLAFVAAPPARATFISEDIGGAAAGSTSPAAAQPPGPVALTGSGADIWNAADQCRYWHDSQNGDFFAAVRIVSLVGGTDAWRKFGLMARADTTAGSMQFLAAATPQGLDAQWRDTADGASGNASFAPGSPAAPDSGGTPYWVALKRVGNTFTALWAPDVNGHPGIWSTPQPAEVHTNTNMPATVQLGLAITSHNTGQFSTGTADSFSVGLVGTPQGRLVNLDGANIGGAAYAQLSNGSTAAPDYWKLERVYYHPGVASQWYLGYQATSTSDFQTLSSLNRPHQDYTLSQIGWSNAGGGAPNPNGYPPETPFTGDMSTYTVRCFGQILVPANPANPTAAQTVTFREQNDDWAVMTVDGQLTAINDGTWTNYNGAGGDGGNNATLTLTPGWHDFEFFMSEGGGGDNARLLWNLDPASGLFDGALATVPSDYFRSIDESLTQLLAQGTGQVGSLGMNSSLFNIGSDPGDDMYMRLAVDFQGSTYTSPATEFMGVPEPASCLLLAAGLVALARRRRQR